ncbi:MAG: hypothetical protein P9L99_05225 [Candidatus Lernaella stagnicola]|nr:hypothetical protein [Candidatus Lernaella stagnicola]
MAANGDINLDKLQTRLFLRAALPMTKVVREDDKMIRLLTKNLTGIVQFEVKGDADAAAHMIFENDTLDVKPGRHENPTVAFVFKDLKGLNDFFAGRPALPSLLDCKGLYRLDILVRVVPLLLSLKILMPEADPKDPEKRALKVKLLLFMVTAAMSQMNKAGEPDIRELTEKSPDRVYQYEVEGGPAAYLRMKAGKTKAGRGIYARRRPFVKFYFPDFDSAYNVLTAKVAMVEAVSSGALQLEGAMEYQKEIGLHMQRVEEILTR